MGRIGGLSAPSDLRSEGFKPSQRNNDHRDRLLVLVEDLRERERESINRDMTDAAKLLRKQIVRMEARAATDVADASPVMLHR